MGLTVEPVSTQVIPRDRHAAFFAALGVVASSLERLATEIRHLQRTEVLEAEEYFSAGQKGSSAMPHKRNPGADGERHGPRTHGALVCDPGNGECGALA
ncbi:MAG: lyase family protein [Rhizomicrobium sp.]